MRMHLVQSLRPELMLDPATTVKVCGKIRFLHNTIYKHASTCFNFTTYNLQRDYNTINPKMGKSAIMVYCPRRTHLTCLALWFVVLSACATCT
jgi:hypothetical protein